MTLPRLTCFCLLANLNLAYDPNYYLTFLKDASLKLADIHSKDPFTVDSNLQCATLCYGHCLGYRYRPKDKFCVPMEQKQISKEEDFESFNSFRMKVGPFCGKPPLIGNSTLSCDGYHFGSVTQYTCSDKYRFCSGAGRSECRSTGRWSRVRSPCLLHFWDNIGSVSRDDRVVKFPCGKTRNVRVNIFGKMTEKKEMNFRLMSKSDVLFLLSVRYNNDGYHKTIVMNTRLDGHWGKNKMVYVDKRKLGVFMEPKKGQKPLKVLMAGSVYVLSLSVH